MKMSTLVAAAAAGLVATMSAGGTAGASPIAPAPPSVATTVRQQLLAGTFAKKHSTIDLCHPAINGTTYDLGCGVSAATGAADIATPHTTGTPSGYGPADLATAFHLPDSSGAAGTVSVIAFGFDPRLESDLAVYRGTYGLPACGTDNGCLHVMDDKGGPALRPGLDPISIGFSEGFAHETMLDVDMVSAACPGCSINVIQVPFTEVDFAAAELGDPSAAADGFASAVDTAAALHSSAVTTSFFISTGNKADYLLHGAPARALDRTGMAVVAAAGDNGYQGTKQLWPAELPTVTSVGGVTMDSSDNGASYSFQAWSGSQSGCASGVDPAVGQPAAVAANCDGSRAVADVSAVSAGLASYDTYYPIGVSYLQGLNPGWNPLLGTSAAAPYIAALYARAGNLDAVHGPNTLYSAAPGTLTDVTTGTNATSGCADFTTTVCTATPGWDGPTGVGAPNGLNAF